MFLVAEQTKRAPARQRYETGVRAVSSDKEKLVRPILMQNVFDEMISENLEEDTNEKSEDKEETETDDMNEHKGGLSQGMATEAEGIEEEPNEDEVEEGRRGVGMTSPQIVSKGKGGA